jgi:hypothetical protein
MNQSLQSRLGTLYSISIVILTSCPSLQLTLEVAAASNPDIVHILGEIVKHLHSHSFAVQLAHLSAHLMNRATLRGLKRRLSHLVSGFWS